MQLVEVGVLWEGVGGAGVAPQLVHQRVVCACDGSVTVAVLHIDKSLLNESTIVSEGFKGGTRDAPIMSRDVCLSDSKCWNGG